MTTLFDDLLAAQAEMPTLQKSAINPHFRNKFVPLEELMEKVIPVLNKHNLVLMQLPTVVDGQAGLTSSLIHKTGEKIESTMLLMCAKDDPQGQGSAITYARRYSLMAMLGLSADADDDGQQATHRNGNSQKPAQRPDPMPRRAPAQPAPRKPTVTPPICQTHGSMGFVEGGKRQDGTTYPSFWGCTERKNGCKSKTVNAKDWEEQQAQFARARGDDPPYDPDDVPNEGQAALV